MAQYIDKAAVVAEIEKLQKFYSECQTRNIYEEGLKEGRLIGYKDALHKLDTTEVEVDLDALGVLAEHLIACDAHGVTPNYTDKEFNLLEEWTKIIKH